MPEKKEKVQKIRFPDVTCDFIVLHEDREAYLNGWTSLEGSFEDLLENMEFELEASWGSKYAEMDDYIIYYIDVLDKYNLIYLTDNEIFQEIKKLDDVFIVILHKNIKYKIIQNIPVVYNWFINLHSNF